MIYIYLLYVDVCKYIVYTLYQWYHNIKPDQSLVYLFLVPTISSAAPVPIACHAILVTVRGLERGHLLCSEEQARAPCLHVLVVFPWATSITSNSSMLTHWYASWIRLTISELVNILWLKASPNWNWQDFGDQWGKFLHFLGRTRIPGWKNILFSWLQTVWHSTGLTRSVDPDFVRNAEVWIDPGGSRSQLWRRFTPPPWDWMTFSEKQPCQWDQTRDGCHENSVLYRHHILFLKSHESQLWSDSGTFSDQCFNPIPNISCSSFQFHERAFLWNKLRASSVTSSFWWSIPFYHIVYISCTRWWFQPLWKIWKSVGLINPNIWKVIQFMFQTTNQCIYIYYVPRFIAYPNRITKSYHFCALAEPPGKFSEV